MSEDSGSVGLSRRRLLGGVVSIGAASVAAGAGTVALLRDTETSGGNTVSVGTLELSVIDGDETTVLEVENAGPGSSGSETRELKNVGSLDGTVDFAFGTYESLEGSNPDSETDTTGDGELEDELTVTVTLGGTEIRSGTFEQVFDGTTADSDVPLASFGTKDLVFEWAIPEDLGNDAQGDIVRGEVTIVLKQRNLES